MRGIYILIGIFLIATPSLACGFVFDLVSDMQGRGLQADKLPDLFKVGFKLSSPISVPLGILGTIFIARGITGRCLTKSKRIPSFHLLDTTKDR
ncbi:hypothetical protein [Mesorhizobium sp. SP-1A]|uniref:hypothetical protein n=1 Tax=Mesorhizobium sp. SP-1A TaxID=3077840 RepID=UPI0028F6CB97|nr:hypothetical protein [Mesorhizobium sp. SP-1A]